MAIYRKGEGQMDDDGRHTELRSAANQEHIERVDYDRGKSAEEIHMRDVASGLQGARNAVNLGVTAAEATENPDTLGGPVSGSAMARLKDIKAEKKRTAAREMKRR
jgi:hypothetical protein